MRIRLVLVMVVSALACVLAVAPQAAYGQQSPTPTTLTQQATLTAVDGTSTNQFGSRVAISGNYAVVSNSLADANQGATYVYNRSGSAWSQMARLTASDGAPDQRFGFAAISGDYIAVTATRAASQKGKVYFFKRSLNTWVEQQSLVPSSAADGDRTGTQVIMSGDTVAIASVSKDGSKGAAYVFVRNPNTDAWSEQAVIQPADLAANDQFGITAALDGDTLAIGTINQKDDLIPYYGAVYVYVRSGSTWTLQQKLTVNDLTLPEQAFGYSLGLSGDKLIVGTYYAFRAYVFKRTGTSWALEQKLKPLVNYAGGFGHPVEIKGNRALVGDRECGCVLVWAFNGVAWVQQQELRPTTVTVNFPRQMALNTTTGHAVISNGFVQPTDTAAVYVFNSNTVGAKQDSIGIYRPSEGTFYLRNSNTTGGADFTVTFGGSNGLPVAGDWNSDGIDSIGVYDSTIGVFRLRDSNSSGAADYIFAFGNPGDVPLAGRWTPDMIGDGVGVYRGSNGVLFLRKTLTSGFSDFFMIFGNPGDRGVAGDWDGDGIDTTGVYRATDLRFFLSNTNTDGNIPIFSDLSVGFGTNATDKPFAGNWTGTNNSGVGTLAEDGTVQLKINPAVEGSADLTFVYGQAGDLPVAGRWTLPVLPPPVNSIVVMPGTGKPSAFTNGGETGAE